MDVDDPILWGNGSECASPEVAHRREDGGMAETKAGPCPRCADYIQRLMEVQDQQAMRIGELLERTERLEKRLVTHLWDKA